MNSIHKAVVAGLGAALGALQIAYFDLSVTRLEWQGIAIAGMVALIATYQAPYKPKDGLS